MNATANLDDALATCGDYRLVEEVVAESAEALTTRSRLSPDAAFHRTDGAGRALLVPGTILLEHAVQSGEALIHRDRGRPDDDGVPVLARVKRVAFRAPVPPGAVLTTEVTLTERVGPAFYVRAKGTVEGTTVLDADLVFTATKAIEISG